MGYGLADSGVELDFISPEEAHAKLKSNEATFVDSRNADEHALSRIQGSVNIASGIIYFKKEKVDKGSISQIRALAGLGKLVIVYSDNGVPTGGQRSRCLHTGQYLVEVCELEREQVVRLEGGLNKWKAEGLDGVLGDVREFFAGKVKKTDEKVLEKTSGYAQSKPVLLGAAVLENALEENSGQNVNTEQNIVQSITAYRVLKGEVYKKATTDAEKIIKIEKPPGTILQTTGKVWTGPSGGRWAECDVEAGEKPGWVYIEGPGFGPSSRHMKFEYLAA